MFKTSIKRLFSPFLKQKSVKPMQNHTSPYQQIGGETATRNLANRFYDIMESDPKAQELLAIHPKPMTRIRHVFFQYLSGWLGGPPLFEQEYGHPRLKQRHMHFAVTPQLAEQWIYCMNKALDIEIDKPLLRAQIKKQMTQLALHMINKHD